MPRRKAAPAAPAADPPAFPREVILDGSRVTADMIKIDGRDYVSITARDGSATDYPLSSLLAVRPHIYKAVFG